MPVADIRGVYNPYHPSKIVSDQPNGQSNISFFLRIEWMKRFVYKGRIVRNIQKEE